MAHHPRTTRTRSWALAVTALAVAAALTGCQDPNADTGSTDAPVVAVTPTPEESCEYEDIIEGDFVEDCYGQTIPGSGDKAKTPSPKATTTQAKTIPTKSPGCVKVWDKKQKKNVCK